MANFCLPPAAVDKFTNALRSGKIDPYKLNKLSSDERRSIFEDIVGKEGAKQVNSEFEKSILLKNQKFAYTNWAKSVAGLKPAVKNDLVSKIGKLDHALNPDEEHGFLKDLASTKLGTNVTEDEARNIVNLSKKAQDAEAAPRSTMEDADKKGFTPNENDMKYAYARYDLEKYVGDLKGNPKRLQLKDFKTNPLQSAKKLPRAVADVSKSIGASLDDSFALRQGSKAFFTNNAIWRKQFIQSFSNLVKGAKNAEEAEREINARLMADPYYDQAVKDGLPIRNVKSVDDVFPTSAPGKIPILGRAFNASEVAYSGFADNLRLGIYKEQIKLANKLGDGVAPEIRKNIAKEVGSLTGRGSFGRGEAIAGHLNAAFYSARFLKANIDTLLLHPAGIGVGGIGSVAQKTAAKNLLKIIAGTAVVLKTADTLKPGSVEWDPRSSNFGQIKVGSTTFDVSGGMRGIITLAARLATQSTKSEAGNVTKIDSDKFGAETGTEVLGDFLQGKLSPIGGIASDVFLTGENENTDKKPTLGSELGNLVPLNVQNYTQLKSSKNSANILASVIADTLGISTNTETAKPSTTPQLTGKAAQAVTASGYNLTSPDKTERGVKLKPAQYTKFTTQVNKNFTQAVQKAINDPTFQNYSKADKKASLSSSMAAARDKALNSMNIKKGPVVHKPNVKTY